MSTHVVIEDIEERRRCVGIDDGELRGAIRGLRIGDYGKLTLLASTDASRWETLLIRITRVKGSQFRGKLAEKPASPSFSDVRVGSSIVFTTSHIHSLAEGWLSRAY
jgi:hypothetical protein